MLSRGIRRRREEDGTSILETALVLPVLLLMLVGAVDLGRAYYTAIEVNSAAHAGAMYGSQNASDVAGMITAANAEAPDVAGLTPTAMYGCECSDGSGISPSCSSTPSCPYNTVYYVEVDTTATYTPLLSLSGVFGPLNLKSSARMRATY